MWFPIVEALWPWIFLCIYVVPVVSIIVYLQLLDVDQDPITDMYGEEFCNGFFGRTSGCNRRDFVVLSLVFNRYYLLYALWMIFVAALVYANRNIATYVIMLENTTYFFNSTSAFFWALFRTEPLLLEVQSGKAAAHLLLLLLVVGWRGRPSSHVFPRLRPIVRKRGLV